MSLVRSSRSLILYQQHFVFCFAFRCDFFLTGFLTAGLHEDGRAWGEAEGIGAERSSCWILFLMFQELIDLWSTHWFADLPTILCVHYAQVDPLTIAAEDCGAVLGSLRHSDDWCMSELWTPCRLWLWTSCQRRLTQRSEMRALFSLALSIHRPSHLDATRTLSPLHLRWLF